MRATVSIEAAKKAAWKLGNPPRRLGREGCNTWRAFQVSPWHAARLSEVDRLTLMEFCWLSSEIQKAQIEGRSPRGWRRWLVLAAHLGATPRARVQIEAAEK